MEHDLMVVAWVATDDDNILRGKELIYKPESLDQAVALTKDRVRIRFDLPQHSTIHWTSITPVNQEDIAMAALLATTPIPTTALEDKGN